MKPYQVQYNLEQYIPEYQQLIKDKIFTEQQINQIAQQREQFERKIQETFTPQLNDAIQYCDHLAACKQLIKQRYQQLGTPSSQQLYSYHKQYMRISKYIIQANKYNYSAYCYFLQFAQKVNDTSLLVNTANLLKQFHTYYYLSYVYLAYNAFNNSGITDCRRYFIDGDKQIRNYQIDYISFNNNVKFTTQCIGEQDQITQTPKDIATFYINWYHIENEYQRQMIENEDEEIEEQSEQEDEQLKLYQNNFYQSFVICKLLQKTQQWYNFKVDQLKEILNNEILNKFIELLKNDFDQNTKKIFDNGITQYIEQSNGKIDKETYKNLDKSQLYLKLEQLQNAEFDNEIRKQHQE